MTIHFPTDNAKGSAWFYGIAKNNIFCNKSQQDALFLQFIFDKELYIF